MPATSWSSAPSRSLDHPGAHDHRARRARAGRLLPPHRPRRPRALRHRLRPGRRRALRPQRPPPGARRVRPQRRARRPRRRRLRRPLRHAFAGAGRGIELQAVAAVVIGGVAIFGGSGTVWGAAIGAFLLVTINRALPILGISDFWQRAVVGAPDPRRDRARPGARRSAGPTSSSKRGTSHDGHLDRQPRPPAPHYPAYSATSWRRLLLTRESAVIAPAGDRLRLLAAQRRELRRPADAYIPAPRHRADPADRAADDADHHHRRDRPLGGQHRRR